ncbi:hypothetical protein P5G62_022230 [Neobacillus sp. 179-C4.2 HS]|uniref:DUF4025 domain-containing protein n=1 Tax=Neobacillus driksii TaxID=3035913 RepID=A0ABV4YZM4_9BACI|nr:hypothetical protein [Neobacillus sp. 179.-C4.2 HS]MDP5194408.1 hypothetical protein [Neobacillus sp. 179.-C4.2 HS]
MKNDPSSVKNIVEANIEINKELEDGEMQEPIQSKSETERANIELQNQFNNDGNKDIRTSPAAISTPQ